MSEMNGGGPSNWTPEQENSPADAVRALQHAIQETCQKANLPAGMTVAGLTTALAWIIMLNCSSRDAANKIVWDHRKSLKAIIDQSWDKLAPIKENFLKQIEAQKAADAAGENQDGRPRTEEDSTH